MRPFDQQAEWWEVFAKELLCAVEYTLHKDDADSSYGPVLFPISDLGD